VLEIIKKRFEFSLITNAGNQTHSDVAVITEYIFAWPGMERVTIEVIFPCTFPLILASTFIGATAFVLGNLLSDLFYLIVYPRIKLANG